MNTSTRRKFIKSEAVAGILSPVLQAAQAGVFVNEQTLNNCRLQPNQKEVYLSVIVEELVKQWPENRTFNLVFHGHSVPSGCFQTPDVRPLQSYPFYY